MYILYIYIYVYICRFIIYIYRYIVLKNLQIYQACVFNFLCYTQTYTGFSFIVFFTGIMGF